MTSSQVWQQQSMTILVMIVSHTVSWAQTICSWLKCCRLQLTSSSLKETEFELEQMRFLLQWNWTVLRPKISMDKTTEICTKDLVWKMLNFVRNNHRQMINIWSGLVLVWWLVIDSREEMYEWFSYAKMCHAVQHSFYHLNSQLSFTYYSNIQPGMLAASIHYLLLITMILILWKHKSSSCITLDEQCILIVIFKRMYRPPGPVPSRHLGLVFSSSWFSETNQTAHEALKMRHDSSSVTWARIVLQHIVSHISHMRTPTSDPHLLISWRLFIMLSTFLNIIKIF